MEKIKVANINEINHGKGKMVIVNGKEISIFKVNDQFFAIDNICLHMGGSLADGWVEENNVTCALHGWQFDIKTGQNIMPGMGKLNSYKLEIKNEDIYIEV